VLCEEYPVSDKTKRNQVEIIAEILKLCRKPTAKTQIMHKINMSYRGVQKFIKQLLKLELLSLENDMKYVITEKGSEFIVKYEELEELLNS
jgi:predicted transcriptional regulator